MQIESAARARVMADEFAASLEQEIRDSNARRFELADYMRRVLERRRRNPLPPPQPADSSDE
ncbi:MAG TPA: hypothetical protein VGE56_07580 [Rhodocyclaceae bacterium]